MKRVFKKLAAFVNGIKEFRQAFTTHYPDYSLLQAYDSGREMAHRLTLRHFDA